MPTTEKEQLAKYLSAAKGYLFPSLEPFGIAPVEALAAGCPVIAFKDGGSREYIVEGKNGIFFEEQTALSLVKAITEFEKKKFNRNSVAKTATKFSVARFDKEITDFIKKCTKKGKNGQKANQ